MNTNDTPLPDVRPDQADISVAVGPDANLSPAVRQALEDLAAAVEQSQSRGITPKAFCDKLVAGPCAIYIFDRGPGM